MGTDTGRQDAAPSRPFGTWPSVLVWAAAWLAMVALDGHIDLGNQALILVLAAALSALWWPVGVSMAACAVAVMAFNFAFVPPRGQFSVDLRQDALLLVTTLAVSWLIALMVERQRRLAANERRQRQRADQLRTLGDALRDAEDPVARGALLQSALFDLAGAPAALLMLREPPADTLAAATVPLLGEATSDERVALWLCLRQRPLDDPADAASDAGPWYVPMRGRGANFGAALVRFSAFREATPGLRAHVQALCDQMGLALERASALRSAAAAREAANTQALRNTLLAAISHDHRTPLATILGAGSSLLQQAEKLSPEQRHRLAATIVDEATQLARLTDNTLQLARLDTPGLALNRDWESVEEAVGTVLRRLRQRMPGAELEIAIEPGLPLVRCDAVLLVQLLDNLVDNAFKYGGGWVRLRAFRHGTTVVIAVDDDGPGVPAAWRERMFEPFQRAPAASRGGDARRGAGVGLAVCRAIARAHGGDIVLRERPEGGSSFELTLPLEPTPATTPAAEPRP